MPLKQISADVVIASALILVDESNQERLLVEVPQSNRDGQVVLRLSDANGRARITLQIDSDGNPRICLLDDISRPAISLTVNAPHTDVRPSAGADNNNPCVEINVPTSNLEPVVSNRPKINVRDHDGRLMWSTPSVETDADESFQG